MTTILRLDEAFDSSESETLEAIEKRLPGVFFRLLALHELVNYRSSRKF